MVWEKLRGLRSALAAECLPDDPDGRWPQPLRVGPGFIRAGFHATGRGVGEHECGGGLRGAAEQVGRAGRLESQGPPVLASRADLGEFRLALPRPGRPVPCTAARLRCARPAGSHMSGSAVIRPEATASTSDLWSRSFWSA